jgi:gamma-glutamyltranspeptidase/glutathione hydrolase/leukotriene-C4 hydrolase
MGFVSKVAVWLLCVYLLTPAEANENWTASAAEEYRFAAVTTDNEICSTVGTLVLAKQGSSVDAAIASLVCLGAVNAQSSGIGGGFMMTIVDQYDGDVETLISRETAPLFTTPDMFESDPDARISGPMSIMVPREIWGYYEAWEKYGRVEWADLFEDTINLCRGGWPVSEHMANAIAEEYEEILGNTGLRSQYLKPDLTPYEEGDIMQDFLLADTLETIANEGPMAFYNGSLAPSIINELHAFGALNFSLADLESHYDIPVWYEPLRMDLSNGDYSMFVPTTPSSGPVISFIMRVLNGYEFGPDDYNTTVEERQLIYHRTLEAFKFAFARKPYMCDIEFADSSVQDWINLLMNGVYADHIRSLINDTYVLEDYSPDGQNHQVPNVDEGTTHLNVMGIDGLAVSATATVGARFGSLNRGYLTGIVYNNMMSLFTTPAMTELSNNWPEPRKRGQSSTIPIVVTDSDGYVKLLVGGAGGTRIITSTTLVLEKFLWFGLDAERSVTAPTINDENNGEVLYEEDFEEDVVDILSTLGHVLQEYESNLSVEQALSADQCQLCWEDYTCRDSCMQGVSDRRKGGIPDGY